MMDKVESNEPDVPVFHHNIWRDYELTETLLGLGGMSTGVFLASKRETGEKVAIKTVKVEGLTLQQRINVHREIQTQASLAHPGLAKLMAVYKSSKKMRLVLEYLEGGTLFNYVKERGDVDESQTMNVVQQLLEAVDHMHRKGVVHRDIKLDNIVFKDQEQEAVKLIDFGLGAFWCEGMEPMKRSCGTPGYAAPEVGRCGYSNKVDIWTLGMVTYMMLTGEVPRWATHGDGKRLLASPKLQRCSQAAQRFVSDLLSVDPQARPSAAEALSHQWLVRRKEASESSTGATTSRQLLPPCPIGRGSSRHSPSLEAIVEAGESQVSQSLAVGRLCSSRAAAELQALQSLAVGRLCSSHSAAESQALQSLAVGQLCSSRAAAGAGLQTRHSGHPATTGDVPAQPQGRRSFWQRSKAAMCAVIRCNKETRRSKKDSRVSPQTPIVPTQPEPTSGV